jgi:hypothetical protein
LAAEIWGASLADGSRSWRNNNPGNLEYGPFARAHGAIGTDGRYAIFPSVEVGTDAQRSKLFDSPAYRDLTLPQAIAKWAPRGENDVPGYLRAMGGDTSGRTMADYSPPEQDALLQSMRVHEGWRPGTGTPGTVDAAPSTVAPLPPARPADLGAQPPQNMPLPPARPADLGAAPLPPPRPFGFGVPVPTPPARPEGIGVPVPTPPARPADIGTPVPLPPARPPDIAPTPPGMDGNLADFNRGDIAPEGPSRVYSSTSPTGSQGDVVGRPDPLSASIDPNMPRTGGSLVDPGMSTGTWQEPPRPPLLQVMNAPPPPSQQTLLAAALAQGQGQPAPAVDPNMLALALQGGTPGFGSADGGFDFG